MPTAADSPMLGRKVFITRTTNPFRDLFERFWDGDEWIWVNHGRPEGTAFLIPKLSESLTNMLRVNHTLVALSESTKECAGICGWESCTFGRFHWKKLARK